MRTDLHHEKCWCFSFCVCTNSATSNAQWKIYAQFFSPVHLKHFVASTVTSGKPVLMCPLWLVSNIWHIFLHTGERTSLKCLSPHSQLALKITGKCISVFRVATIVFFHGNMCCVGPLWPISVFYQVKNSSTFVSIDMRLNIFM